MLATTEGCGVQQRNFSRRKITLLRRSRSWQGVHIIADAIRPSSGVIQEADPDAGTRVVVVAGLDDLRAIFLECC